MIARHNYTGRSRIARRQVKIDVHEGSPRTFSASWNGLRAGAPLPSKARIYVEATSTGSAVIERFACGTVAEPEYPERVPLRQVTGRRVIFSLKVVEEDEDSEYGLLLAVADGLRPRSEDQDTLLPVDFVETLGERAWQVVYGPVEVVLQVNNRLFRAEQELRDDRHFWAYVLPEIVRQVLERVVIEHRHSTDSGADDWLDRWLRFARTQHPDTTLSPEELRQDDDDDDVADLRRWIDAAVDGFCQKKGLIDSLLRAEEDDDEPA